MERKQTEDLIITDIDEAQGIVEAFWAVMGNVDDGNDIIHPGAFKRTFHQRGNQINLLDNHRATSVMDSLGTVLELQEKSRADLPGELLTKYPDATGGAWGKFQFLMDTPEGKGAFTRIKTKAVKGWSFGYDAIQKDHSTVTKDDKKIPVRNLRELKLYEISPVLFPMNEATTTTDAKAKPQEGKPWAVVEEDGSYNVYKLDEDGEPMGKPLGEHDTEEEAEAQVAALYANEDKATWSAAFVNDLPDSSFLYVESGGEKDGDGKTTPRSLRHFPYKDSEGQVDLPHLRNAVSRLSQTSTGSTQGERWLSEDLRKTLLGRARGILEEANKASDIPEDQKAGRVLSAANIKRIMSAMSALHDALAAAGVTMGPSDDSSKSSEALTSNVEPDSPIDDDTRKRYINLIEVRKRQLEKLEV